MNIDLLFTFIYFFNQTDSKMIVLGWLFALDPIAYEYHDFGHCIYAIYIQFYQTTFPPQ